MSVPCTYRHNFERQFRRKRCTTSPQGGAMFDDQHLAAATGTASTNARPWAQHWLALWRNTIGDSPSAAVTL